MGYCYVHSSELYHHGILGMKWGVRRYQNYDGSLTAAGKKRYDRIGPDRTRREIQKAVNAQREEKYGSVNRWRSSYGIGKNSDKVQAEKKKAYNDWTESDAYKNAVKTQEKLDTLYNKGKISVESYDSQYHKAWEEAIKTRPASNSYMVVGNGRKYVDNYVQTVGKQLTIAYLKDLGFDDAASRYIEKIIRKSGKQTLD